MMTTQVEWPDLMLLNTYVPSTFVADETNPKQHDATQKERQTAKDFRVAWDAEALRFATAGVDGRSQRDAAGCGRHRPSSRWCGWATST